MIAHSRMMCAGRLDSWRDPRVAQRLCAGIGHERSCVASLHDLIGHKDGAVYLV